MKRKALLSSLLLQVFVLVTSCKDAYKFEELEKAVPVVLIENFPKGPVKIDSLVTVSVKFQPENGCGRYSNIKQTTEPLIETYQILAAYPTDPEVVCAEISQPIRYSFQYKFTQLGKQKFRFWKEEGKYLEAEVLVEAR